MSYKESTNLDSFLKRGVFSQKIVRNGKDIDPGKTFVGNLAIPPSELMSMREVKSFVGELVKKGGKIEMETKDTNNKVSNVIPDIKKAL